MHLPATIRTTRSLAALTLAGVCGLTAACSGFGDASSSPSRGGNAVGEARCDSGESPTFTGKATAFDAPAAVENTHALSTQASAPALTTQAASTKGFRIARVRVDARVLTNGVFAVHPESFVLVDADGHRCGQPERNGLSDALPVSQVDEAKSAAGSVSFVVPAEANLSNYTVYYLQQPGSNTAVAAWSGTGTAPAANELTTCSPGRSGYVLNGVPDHQFGATVTAGDSQVSLKVTPSGPTTRDLPPGPEQPNDVRAVAITVRVEATGAEGFVGRTQFQLLDNTGHLCQYNELGSSGETLTSALVEVGKPASYTLVFWTPRGSQVAGWKLLYVPNPTTKKVAASWTTAPVSPMATGSPTSTR